MGRKLFAPCAACLFLACIFPANALSIPSDYLALPVKCSNRLIITRVSRIDNLFAIDARTRGMAWQGMLEDRGVDARPVVADGVAFVWMSGTYDKPAVARAVDGRTGKLIWETRTHGAATGPAIVAGETVLCPINPNKYGIGEKREIQSIDRKTGKRGWKMTGNLLGVFGSVAIVSKKMERELLLYDVPSRKVVFQTKLDDEGTETSHAACNEKGQVAIGSENNLMALDIPSRKLLWRMPSDGFAWLPTIEGNKVYLVSATSLRQLEQETTDIQRIEVRDLSSGQRLMAKELKAGDYATDAAVVLDGTLVVASGDFVVGLAADSLEEKWRISVPEVYEMGRVANTVMLGLMDSRLWNLDPATGRKIWTYQALDSE